MVIRGLVPTEEESDVPPSRGLTPIDPDCYPSRMPKRCFVIGPMSEPNRETLRWLAFDVVKPLLPPGFHVSTPDVNVVGNIMHHVIQSCDRAHLVIANTTGNNPNVLYEMAVLDAMGRACIPIKIVDDESDQHDRMPFDRAQYRYFNISRSPDKLEETKVQMRELIESTLAIRDEGNLYENPLTDYFGLPLSSFSSAFGLARSYFLNLLMPAVMAIDRNEITDSAFNPAEYPEKRLEVVIPRRLSNASRGSVDNLLKSKRIRSVRLEAKGRKIFIYEWIDQNKPVFRWMDVPTTLDTLHGTVLGRRGRHANPDDKHPDYLEIEEDEIGQFQRYLKGLVHKESGAYKPLIKIISWKETSLPREELIPEDVVPPGS